MSREVRRVPVGWQHPLEFNPHWEAQAMMRAGGFGGTRRPESRLHGIQERFVALMADYPEAAASWERERAELESRAGFSWTFEVERCVTGTGECSCHPGRQVRHQHFTYNEYGDEIAIDVRDEDHLQELLLDAHERVRPDPEDYMPVFDVPEDELGWCLYQTVSEGSPVTPVFATADELVEHLATAGQDWDQVPMRREAAESLVRTGWSFGSGFVVAGQAFRSDLNADVLDGTADQG